VENTVGITPSPLMPEISDFLPTTSHPFRCSVAAPNPPTLRFLRRPDEPSKRRPLYSISATNIVSPPPKDYAKSGNRISDSFKFTRLPFPQAKLWTPFFTGQRKNHFPLFFKLERCLCFHDAIEAPHTPIAYAGVFQAEIRYSSFFLFATTSLRDKRTSPFSPPERPEAFAELKVLPPLT